MNMPGFNGGSSTYRTSNIYRASYGTRAGDVAIIPQQCADWCAGWTARLLRLNVAAIRNVVEL